MTPNDKNNIIQLMKQPGWDLLKKELQESALGYRFQATMPDVEEHYRLILFAKAQGIEEMFNLSKDLIK